MEQIYSKVEIDAMLQAPKWAAAVDWIDEANWPQVRETPGERAVKFPAFPDGIDTDMSFQIEMRFSRTSRAFSITLHGQIGGEKWQSLCRYDIHANAHPNEKFCLGPEEVPEGELHRHVYNENGLRHLGRWHACAELVGFSGKGTPKERREFLKMAFLEYVHLVVKDSETHRKYYGFPGGE